VTLFACFAIYFVFGQQISLQKIELGHLMALEVSMGRVLHRAASNINIIE